MASDKKGSAVLEGKNKEVYRMATVKECEKLRGLAEVKLNSELRKLRKTCQNAAPNERLVSNLLACLDAAYNYLVDAHVVYVMKMGSDLTRCQGRRWHASGNN